MSELSSPKSFHVNHYSSTDDHGCRRSFADPALISDDRVLKNMLKLEEQHTPANYFSNGSQRDIKPFMRKIVATWMLEVF